MSHEGSVTQWLHALRDNNQDAAHDLWQRYFHRIQGLARRRLGDQGAAHTDAEDAALDVGRLGSDTYSQVAFDWIVDSTVDAVLAARENLQPARFGWTIVEAYDTDDAGLRAFRLFWTFVVALWPPLYVLVYLW